MSDYRGKYHQPITVCMASYNGGLYISEQIKSILNEFSLDDDELIIVDDASTDNSIEKIKNVKDVRVKLHQNTENKGIIFTFEKAISLAQNAYIFTADQDDIWLKGRRNEMIYALEKSESEVLVSNYTLINNRGERMDSINPNELKTEDSHRTIRNLIHLFQGSLNYFGCAMVLRRRFLKYILPFPKFIDSHDIYIGLAAILNFSIHHHGTPTLDRRLHGKNASVVTRTLLSKLWSRCILFYSVFIIVYRILRIRYFDGRTK